MELGAWSLEQEVGRIGRKGHNGGNSCYVRNGRRVAGFQGHVVEEFPAGDGKGDAGR